MQSQANLQNRLLREFPAASWSRLSAEFEPVRLQRRMELVEPGVASPVVYFPDYGLVSLVKTMTDGRTVEIGVVGPEGLIGVSALFGMTQPTFEAIVQVEGTAYRISTAALKDEATRSPLLQALISRYMRYRISSLAQTAACNRLHTMRHRCCSWLLKSHDAVQRDTFTLTHEFLALVMGVSRSRLSLILQAIQKEGLIDYHYGALTIQDRCALEQGACECYETLRHEAELVIQPVN